MANGIQQQASLLERHVGTIGTIAVISPFLGLLGTITGMISSFSEIAARGLTGPGVIATGVYEALYTTAAGLIIAIPAVIFHNYFRARIKETLTDMEINANKLLEIIVFVKKGKAIPAALVPAKED